MTDNRSPARITMYTTRWCADCSRAKRLLGKHNIEYDEIDIAHDDDARAYVEKVNGGYPSVPPIVFPTSKGVVEARNPALAPVLGGEGLLAPAFPPEKPPSPLSTNTHKPSAPCPLPL